MTSFNLAMRPYSDSLVRTQCPKCGVKMWLSRIEPAEPGHENRTFECPECQHELSTVVKFE